MGTHGRFAPIRSPRPEAPTRCPECQATEFRWDAGYKGSFYEPPEPSGWYCAYCENRDFDQPEKEEEI